MTVSQLPVYFLSHTGPTQAFDDPASIKFLAELGQTWTSFSHPAPNSILVLSGHWEGEHGVARVRTSEKNEIHIDVDTVQDIPEFQELPEYVLKLEYNSRGSPRLANRVLEVLAKAGIPAEEETKRGIDHGVWGPFVAILPKPSIPIVQMSLVEMRGQPAHEIFAFHIKLGRALAELRKEGVLIVGSGTAVHNLRDHAMMLHTGGKVAPYVAPFAALLDKVALTEAKTIQYTLLTPAEYSQQTLGVNSGTRIETDQILLEPLLLERDAPKLWETYKNHPQLFAFMPHGPCQSYEEFYNLQAKFCRMSDYSNWLCYVSGHSDSSSSSAEEATETSNSNHKKKKTWVLCGSVCLLDIYLPFRKCEVGAIWFHPAVHGTFVMLETNLALLRFAFERLHSGRVQWKTHFQNIASQKAAVKLGFSLEGVHRKHMIHADGTWRHTHMYAMTDDDWFGREETVEARPPGQDGLAVVHKAYAATPSKGRRRDLEALVETKKREGKPLPSSVVEGQALN
ncbi:hypothetical protein EC968_007731 [Mortierella alpina]|nr:hypothetical protein EC968_007731 [Mortierella alpina]